MNHFPNCHNSENVYLSKEEREKQTEQKGTNDRSHEDLPQDCTVLRAIDKSTR